MKLLKFEPLRGFQRDLCVAAISAVVAGSIVAAWYEVHSGDFSLICRQIEWRLRLIGTDRKIPTVRSNRVIPKGTLITLDALTTTHEFDEAHLPANPIDDPWIAVDRRALRNIPKGELVDFSDVFPRYLLP